VDLLSLLQDDLAVEAKGYRHQLADGDAERGGRADHLDGAGGGLELSSELGAGGSKEAETLVDGHQQRDCELIIEGDYVEIDSLTPGGRSVFSDHAAGNRRRRGRG